MSCPYCLVLSSLLLLVLFYPVFLVFFWLVLSCPVVLVASCLLFSFCPVFSVFFYIDCFWSVLSCLSFFRSILSFLFSLDWSFPVFIVISWLVLSSLFLTDFVLISLSVSSFFPFTRLMFWPPLYSTYLEHHSSNIKEALPPSIPRGGGGETMDRRVNYIQTYFTAQGQLLLGHTLTVLAFPSFYIQQKNN